MYLFLAQCEHVYLFFGAGPVKYFELKILTTPVLHAYAPSNLADFGIAMWGKDFCPKEHAEIIRESERLGYRPTVDVFLPICKEPLYLLENTWKYVAALDYPNVKVYVLDDGGSDEVQELARTFGFNCEFFGVAARV